MSLFYQSNIANSRKLSFLLIIPLLGLFAIQVKEVFGAWVDDRGHLTNLSRRDLYERKEIGFFPDESQDDENLIRERKALPKNPITKRVSMLFKDKDRGVDEKLEDFIYPGPFASVDNYTTIDFIVRLQEKYEYQTCEQYARLTPKEEYFQFDESLVYLQDGDSSQQEEKLKRLNQTKNHRYRLHGESCNHKNEWQFWHDMFVVSENDIITDNNTDSGAFSYTRVPQHVMIQRWGDIWKSYQEKRVCNQKLLLECAPEFSFAKNNFTGKFICSCRRNLVGLSTIFNVVSIPTTFESYTTKYYYDNKQLINEVESLHPDKLYRETMKCVMVASLPFIGTDINIISPCDFFLPMIGMCITECVENATCTSVDIETMQKTEEIATPDPVIRVKQQRSHSKYYNKCVCKQGMQCRNTVDVHYSGGARLGMSIGRSFLQLLLILFSDKFLVPQLI